ncbi:oligosaccharide flippase family protein [Vibrio lentus]|uniref:oligosaccharide flippase family protein n=1 Tax=Vibrio lentus TaxID=136468 RepID=UPI0035535BDF
MKVINNGFILVLIRVIQFGFPLLIYPYFISLFGLDKFGELSFWLSISYFFGTLVSLNMESHASQQIYEFKNQELLLKRSISIPLIIRLTVFIISLIGWFVFSVIYSSDFYFFILVFFSCYPLISIGLQPNFYFLAMGDYALSLKSMIFEKCMFLILIYFIIKDGDAYYLLPLCYFISNLISISLVYFNIIIKNDLDIASYLTMDNSVIFKKYMIISTRLLVGKFTQIHTSLSKSIIGMLFNYEMVAIYDIAEKIVNATKVPLVIVFQATYSKISMNGANTIKLFLVLLSMSFMAYLGLSNIADFLLNYFLSGTVSNRDITSFSLSTLSLIIFSVPFMQTFGAAYIVKNVGANIYANIMIVSNCISMLSLGVICFLGVTFPIYIYWVVFAEFLFALLCTIFVYYQVCWSKGCD